MNLFEWSYKRYTFKWIGWLYLLVRLSPVVSQDSGFSDDYPIKELDLKASWTNLEFEFPSEIAKQCAIENGLYVENVGIPFDVAVDYSQNGTRRIFTTIPRLNKGIPFALAVVSNRNGPKGPILQPYPSYEWHLSHGDDCDGITNVFRVAIDDCQRIWVMDTGEIEFRTKCPPQILIFDLKTNKLLHRYKIPESQYTPDNTGTGSIVLDKKVCNSNNDCSNIMAYITDLKGNNIIVYDLAKGRSWVATSRWMYPEPRYGNLTILNGTLFRMEGIYSTSVTPCNYPNRKLVFTLLASKTAYYVPLSLINNRHAWTNLNQFPHDEAFSPVTSLITQMSVNAMDKYARVYIFFYEPLSIGQWDTTQPPSLDSIKVVAYNPKTLQFVSGMKILKNPRGKEEIWVTSNRILKQSFRRDEIRFRIMACSIKDLNNSNINTCKEV